MFENYLKVAFRTLGKHKGYSLLNIIGLAIGMGCFILISLFVRDELSYDRFHAKGERIYRIAGEYDQGGDTRNRSAQTTYLMKRWLDTSFPDIQNVVRLDFQSGLVKLGEKMFQEDGLLFADANFFEVFTFALIQGDPSRVIDEPNSMVITETIAHKYFGKRDPLGQTLDIDGTPIKITGIMKDMPANSHFHGDFVISMKTAEPRYPKWVLTNATGTSHYTYIELAAGVPPAKIETQLADYLMTKDKHFAESRTYFLQPLRDIHLHSNLSSEIEANGDILYVYILSAVAFIILLMACINYMNLAVARSASRSREVGIRKVAGAGRKQLVLQFLGESIVASILALILALLLVEISMPVFNQLTGKSLGLDLTHDLAFAVAIICLALVVGVLAGSYPSLFLSSVRAINILKGRFAKAGTKSVNLRKGLVIVQFTASIALLVSTLIIYNQLTFMRNKKLGINPELVVTVPFQTREITAQFEQMRTELLRNPEILSVTATNNPLTSRVGNWREYKVEGRDEEVMIPTMVVAEDFFKTLQGEIVSGRDFSRGYPTDVNEAYIINESAAKFLGLESPVGVSIDGAIFTGSEWSKKYAKIIGVVKDFHLASLHTEIQPAIFSLYSEKTTPLRVMAIRISSKKMTNTLSFIEATWKKFAPGRPLQYTFMDEDVGKLYQAEARFLQIFLTFAGLVIAVSCLGVFGLSAYTAAQRTKELGIRKVLGASATSIFALVSGDFVKLVLPANLIAWPIAYFAMNQWLQDFAYRVGMAWWVFALAGGLALLIALLTVSTQAIKAALCNPVEALRYE